MAIRYHRGSDNNLSLDFVSPDEDEFTRWKTQGETTHTITVKDCDEGPLYLGYTPSMPSTSTQQMPSLQSWSDGTATIAATYLAAFTGVTQSSNIQENKNFDSEKVRTALERVTWKRTIPEVAASLWSNLVLAHPLPNANHRSALALASIYIRAREDSVHLSQDVQSTPAVETLVNEFFADSKRLLTIRRNMDDFRTLLDHGITTVIRKGNVHIDLTEYSLSCNDPYAEYASAHKARSEAFFREYLQATGHSEVSEWADPGKHAFVQHLQSR